MRHISRQLLNACGLILLLIAFYLILRRFVSIERVVAIESELRSHIQQYPVRSFVVGMVAYILLSMVPGTSGKAIVYGWLYGFWVGLVQVNVGLTVAAVISFWLSRYVFRQTIQSRFAYAMGRVDDALARDGPFLVVALRLLHVPFTLVNYSMGTTSMRTATFWWSSQLGMLPGCILFVLMGAQLPTLKDLLNQGPAVVFTPRLTAVFVAMAVFPFIVRRFVRRPRTTHNST